MAGARSSRVTRVARWRQLIDSQQVRLGIAVVLTVATGLLEYRLPQLFPLSTMLLVAMVGGFFLKVRHFALLFVTIVAATAWVTVVRDMDVRGIGPFLLIGAGGLLVYFFVRSRERLGVQGTDGSSMLVDLRDRIRDQAQRPDLPRGWHLETAIRSANGESFAGDFVVTGGTDDELAVLVVDVSGKGRRAGTRALMLSAAFGGILGSVAPPQVMPAVNEYLLRQNWREGFATAMHLSLDCGTGDFALTSAGHPPAGHFHAGSGTWEVLRPEPGLALGIVDGIDYQPHHGTLLRGDALVLYTDGMVETPGRDLDLGIDRLIGMVARLVSRGGFPGGAEKVIQEIRAQDDDDRSLLLLWRD